MANYRILSGVLFWECSAVDLLCANWESQLEIRESRDIPDPRAASRQRSHPGSQQYQVDRWRKRMKQIITEEAQKARGVMYK